MGRWLGRHLVAGAAEAAWRRWGMFGRGQLVIRGVVGGQEAAG